MGYEREDVRKFVAHCQEDSMNEVFSPMRSLAGIPEENLNEVRRKTIETLFEAFTGHLGQAGIGLSAAPVELWEAARLVIEEAFKRGYQAAQDE